MQLLGSDASCVIYATAASSTHRPLPQSLAFSQPDGPPTRTLSASGSAPGAWGVSREDRTIMVISNTLAGTRAGMSSVRQCQASRGPGALHGRVRDRVIPGHWQGLARGERSCPPHCEMDAKDA